MPFLEGFIRNMRIGEEDENDEYQDYEEDPVPSIEKMPEEEPIRAAKTVSSKPYLSRSRKALNVNDISVIVFKPTSVDESKEIMATFKENNTLVLNLEETDPATAQRILDFVAGCCFALNGRLQKISNYIFLADPANVDVSGDLQGTLADSL